MAKEESQGELLGHSRRARGGASSSSKKRLQGNDRRNIWLLILTTLLVVISVFLFVPPQEKINQGLDIQGGLSVVLTASSTDGEAITPEDLEKSRAIVESRVNALGASETSVQVQGMDQILVQIPGVTDAETALAAIGATGKLEFARLDSFTDETAKSAIENGQYMRQEVVTDDYGNSLPTGSYTYMSVEPGTYTPIVTGDNITRVLVQQSSNATGYEVDVTLDAAGAQAFGEATAELAPTHGQIVIILDGEVQSAPSVQSEIPDGNVSITGNYSQSDAFALQTVLESGSLPVSFSFSQSQVVGPTLGQDALIAGLIVALIGLLVVMIYLLFFYRGLGIITAAAILIFAVLYLGILAALSAFGLFSLSLAGVAGIVLTIGMAADSSILTLERFREEIRMGRSIRAASITGVWHAIKTSIDADLVTLVSALCLFFLASASVKGFGTTLALGIFCDIIMMLIFKAPLIRLMAPRIIRKHPGFWDIKDCQLAAQKMGDLAEAEGQGIEATTSAYMINPEETRRLAISKAKEYGEKAFEAVRAIKGRFIKRDINFLGHRKVFLIISAVLIACSCVAVGVRGLNFGIEFVGGTSITFTNTGNLDTEELRAAFAEIGKPEAVIQTAETNGTPGFLVRTTTTSAEEAAADAASVASALGISQNNIEVSTIGPDWGASVINASLIAFVVSLLLIIAYIAIRFEYKMGVMAIVALLHDLIIVVGVYALFGREITPNTIAALLTILGYSLYDTVVVFHRISDNMKSLDIRCSFMTMANHSVNQVFIRTINTTLTSLIPVLAMLFFGSETLKDFAFAMVIGLVTGSYSSIGLATPLFAIWKTREEANQKLLKRFGPRIGAFSFKQASALTPVMASAQVSAGTGEKDGVSERLPVSEVTEAASPVARSAEAPAGSTARTTASANKPKSNHHYRRKKR